MTTMHRTDAAAVLAGIGRHWGWGLFFGLVTALTGLLALAWPGRTVVAVAVLFGLQLMWTGAYRFVGALATDENDSGSRMLAALLGVLSFLFGLYSIRHLFVTVVTLAVLLGIFWIVNGAVEVFTAIASRDTVGRGWALAKGALGVTAGIVSLAYPGISLATLAVVLGAWLVVYGFMEIVAAFQIRAARGALMRFAPSN